MSKNWERIQSAKIVLIMLGITLWSVVILVRLVQIQVVQHDAYAQSAQKKQQNTQSVSAPRGIIYDTHMTELAKSVTVKSVAAEPRRIENKPETARALANILKISYKELLQRMSDPKRQKYLSIKHKIDDTLVPKIKSLGIKGIYFYEESMRVYPNNDLASHALGFVNYEGDGGEGIELKYDKVLKGEDGYYSFDIDARRRPFGVNLERPPVQGHSLVLSIDSTIQNTTDRELEAAVLNAEATAGTAIVMESDTGRILALSNYPRFNCNIYNTYESSLWRNRAVTDMFEPGSTFKVVVATAALEAGLTRPDDIIDCEKGSFILAGHPFRDHDPLGKLTFTEVLEHSSNIGAVKLGLRLGQQRLYEAIRDFGFGSRTGIDLPGEIVGSVQDTEDWSGLSIGSISFGQEIGVTSIQILTAINAIANGGYLVRPSVVDRIIDADHNTVQANHPETIQIMKPRTAEAVIEAFEGAVLRGTGRRAALEGYRSAGKTGTAQKIVSGRYQKGVYVSSFIGFAPLPYPRVTILVQLDEPQNGYYGGDVCAPYFKNIAQEVMLQLRIPPDISLPLPEHIAENPKHRTPIADAVSKDFLPDATPAQLLADSDKKPLSNVQQDVITVPLENKWIVMPDFHGLSKRNVLNRCIEMGIHLQAKGSGVAILQSPSPGTEIPIGTTCHVTFTKTDLKEHVATLERSLAARQAGLGPASGNSP